MSINNKSCKECKENLVYKNIPDIPYIVLETSMARNERREKRLILLLIIAIIFALVTNIGWLIYESQYEEIGYSYDYQQDGHGTNIIGNWNDVNNGAETSRQN